MVVAAGRHPRVRREHRDTGALADDLQLADGAGALQVTGHQQRGVPLRLEPLGELAGQRRLTGALQAREHDHRRRRLGERQLAGLAAEDADEFLVDDLDDLLGRVQRAGDLRALGAFLDAGDEVAHHGQRDVGFEQGQADLAAGGVDVGFGQPPLAAQARERTGQPVGERFKHADQPNFSHGAPRSAGCSQAAQMPARPSALDICALTRRRRANEVATEHRRPRQAPKLQDIHRPVQVRGPTHADPDHSRATMAAG